MIAAWTVALASLLVFWVCICIGANDLSNAFSSAWASGALTYKEILVLGVLFETFGVFLLTPTSTDAPLTMLFPLNTIQQKPDIYAASILCAYFGAAVVLTFFTMSWPSTSLPVSTTHAIGIPTCFNSLSLYVHSWRIGWSSPDPLGICINRQGPILHHDNFVGGITSTYSHSVLCLIWTYKILSFGQNEPKVDFFRVRDIAVHL
jgi:hypothetical protein